MTVRQAYYVGAGWLWPKDTGRSRRHYKTVIRLIGEMRESEMLPWGWITDNTRSIRRDMMFASKEDALARWAEAYRRDLWASQPNHVEVWCESDSIAGVLDPVTRPWGVSLFVCRGQAPKTFVYEAVQSYHHIDKPVTILYVGDWDPSGLAIPRSVEERVGRYNGASDVNVERLAVTWNDAASGSYQSHAVNARDPNYQRFADTCRLYELDPHVAVEVEALPPDELRSRVHDVLDELSPDAEAWDATVAAEESEREIFRRILAGDTSAWTSGADS